jgi:hypothetical protein
MEHTLLNARLFRDVSAKAQANVQDAIKHCLDVRAEMGMPLTVLTRQVEVIA